MAFTSTWSAISSAQTDADSPLDVTLMEGIRQNLIYLNEWVGQGYTPSTAHNHNGVNSANVILGVNSVGSSAILSTAVEVSHLKLATGTWTSIVGISSATTWADITIHAYGHNFSMQVINQSADIAVIQIAPRVQSVLGDSGNVYRMRATITPSSLASSTYYVSWIYHTS